MKEFKNLWPNNPEHQEARIEEDNKVLEEIELIETLITGLSQKVEILIKQNDEAKKPETPEEQEEAIEQNSRMLSIQRKIINLIKELKSLEEKLS